jgi:hypothetical protein
MGAEFDARGAAAGTATVDWSDHAGLDQIVKILALGDNVVVVELSDGREIRITAWLELGTGRYVSEFERRCSFASSGRTLHVWSKTPAYRPVIGDSAAACLEAAVLEVDHMRVF